MKRFLTPALLLVCGVAAGWNLGNAPVLDSAMVHIGYGGNNPSNLVIILCVPNENGGYQNTNILRCKSFEVRLDENMVLTPRTNVVGTVSYTITP